MACSSVWLLLLRPIKGKPRERRASASESSPRSKTPKDTKGMRWDLRKSRWVPDVPFAFPKRDPPRPDALWRTGGAMEAQRERARATASHGEVQKPERASGAKRPARRNGKGKRNGKR